MLHYQILVSTRHGNLWKTIYLTYHPEHGMKYLLYLTNLNLHEIFEKTLEKFADNPPIKIYIDKIENRITI